MNWDELVRTPGDAPITSLGLPASKHLTRKGIELYVLADQVFAFGFAPFEQLSLGNVFWAASEGAARRCIFDDIEADSEEIVAAPPEAILLPGGDPTYAGILNAARAAKLRTMESGSYRIPDGLFVHREVMILGSHTYYFRQTRVSKKEMPYVIQPHWPA